MNAEASFDDDVSAVTFEHADDTVTVIVGSGAGGGTLANELAQRGVDVVVLEAGPRFTADDFVNDEYAMTAKFGWHDKRVFEGTTEAAAGFPGTPASMCKGVGGTTLHWAAMCPRFLDFELRTRAAYGAIDGADIIDWPLTPEALAPYYDRAEDKMGVSGTNGMPRHRGNNNYRVIAAGARRLGYTQVDANNMAINVAPRDGRNACDQIGFCMQGCTSGAKWSSFNAEIPKAEATGRCEVRPQCMALKIEHDDSGRVAGVVYADSKGAHHLQKARAVCVAGNAIETPRLLLNSETARFPDGLANAEGAIGRYYMRHMSGYVYAEFERPVHMYRGIQCGGVIRDDCRDDPARGFAGGIYYFLNGTHLPYCASDLNPHGWGRALAEWIEAYERIAAVCVYGEDLAVATNRVTVHGTEKDRFGLPIPVVHVDDHPNELAMRNYGQKTASAFYDAAGARRTHEACQLPASHNMGTCRMSEDSRDGVTDKWGRCHQVPNLFISDGSQFSSSAAANPTLTIVALAVRQAEFIAQQMAQGDL